MRAASRLRRCPRRILVAATLLLVGGGGLWTTFLASTGTAGAATLAATTPSWCGAHGATFAGWAGTDPELPICGPGPDYGGTWADVVLPGPTGAVDGYINATPGFQCVEFAERFLAIADEFAPVHAEGSTVAANYHAVYRDSELVVNGSRAAVGFPPEPGDVLSLSTVPDFDDPTDGHVAVVTGSRVDPAGNGTIVIAQQNVAPADYRRVLDVVDWRIEDPQYPGHAEFQYPYAEWLVPHPYRPHPTPALIALLTRRAATAENPLASTDALLFGTRVPARVAPVQFSATRRAIARARADAPGRAVPAPRRSRYGPAPVGLVGGLAGLTGLGAVRRRRVRGRRRARALAQP